MFNHQYRIEACGWTVIAPPFLLMCVLGLPTLVGYALAEHTVSRAVQIAIVTGLVASLVDAGDHVVERHRHVAIDMGTLVSIPNYHFSAKLVFDRLSIPLVIMAFVLCGTIGAFTSRYLHREAGFIRFHVLYSFFVLGMIVTAHGGRRSNCCLPAGNWWGFRPPCWSHFTWSVPGRCATGCACGRYIAFRTPPC